MVKQIGMILAIVLCVLLHAKAQFSTIYIEPIKGIPCKVLLNQVEIQSLSKSFFLISLPQNEEAKIDIVFGNEIYPVQSFIVDAVENCSYAYKLAKTQEDKFYLLDLVNNGKIVETNTVTNIGLSTENNRINFFDPSKKYAVVEVEKEKKGLNLRSLFGIKDNEEKKTTLENPKLKPKTSTLEVKPKPKPKLKPVLVKPKPQAALVKPKAVELAKNNLKPKPSNFKVKEKEKQIIDSVNTCLLHMQEPDLLTILEQLTKFQDDESRLIFCKKMSFTSCLSVEQTSEIAKLFDTQYGRYAVIKHLSTIIFDIQNVKLLERLFQSDSYKLRLKDL